jgi:chromosome segregation ATPase
LRQKSSLTTQKLNERIAELSGQVNAFSANEGRYQQERESLINQIEELNEELVKAQRNYEAVQVDSRRLVQELQSLRQSNTLLTERMQLVIKRAAAATEANKVLSTRLSTVERERDAVRSLISVERQRSSDLSQVRSFSLLYIPKFRTEEPACSPDR